MFHQDTRIIHVRPADNARNEGEGQVILDW